MIEKGDKVRIEFDHMSPIEGVVEGLPIATGDAWKIVVSTDYTQFQEAETQLVYVQQYTRMWLISR